MNYGVDKGFYPLGSCTMKYNPKINEEMARLPGFAQLHPYQDLDTVQGALALMYHLQECLKEIGGFAAVSLQPAAGSQGELAGILMIRAYHRDRGEGKKRIKMLIPDSAHGTNPASSAMAGLQVVNIPSDRRGNIDLDALRRECDRVGEGGGRSLYADERNHHSGEHRLGSKPGVGESGPLWAGLADPIPAQQPRGV